MRAGYYELFVPVAARPPVLPVFAKWTGTGWAEFSAGDRDNLAVMNAQEYMGAKLVYWRGVSSARGANAMPSRLGAGLAAAPSGRRLSP